MANKKAYLEFLRFPENRESAINTYTEVSVGTPVSRTDKRAMLIHIVEFTRPANLDVAADNDEFGAQITKQSKATLITLNDDDVIVLDKLVLKMLTSGITQYNQNKRIRFDPPILYAKSSIFFGIKSTGQAAVKTSYCRVGYTLETVPSEVFIDALVD